ncbi:hypothetical protein AVDCRST_MAG92-3095 [uncultured Coleofasciculus sp.]|uniref:Ribbon-helix-helix protein CopG domain-containing protein n=1 Tax=uncultured Coleofasciculus sp. TaxID=1267456 RepID=A0A6J4J882_9CYAN|nr:hypothetical protein AVDCRST_MAG92-3095 [uncultured Coleofasciculus sp.]
MSGNQSKPTVGLRIDQEDLGRIDEIAKMSGRTRSDVMLEAILNYWDIRRYEVVKADINELRIELETRLAGIEKKLRLSSWQYRPTQM